MNLKKGQVVYVKNKKYIVVSMIQYKGSSYTLWEYEIVDYETSKYKILKIKLNENNLYDYYIFEDNHEKTFSDGKQYYIHEEKLIIETSYGPIDAVNGGEYLYTNHICKTDESIISTIRRLYPRIRPIAERCFPIWRKHHRVKGYKISSNNVIISDEIIDKRLTSRIENPKGWVVAHVVGAILVILAIIGIISFILSYTGVLVKNQTIQKYISKQNGRISYDYVTSIKNDINGTEAKIYKTNIIRAEGVVNQIVHDIPEVITKVLDYNPSTEEDGFGLETKNEYAYVYKKNGFVYVQVSEKDFIDNRGTAYDSNYNNYYQNTYFSGNESKYYTKILSGEKKRSMRERKNIFK